MHRDPHRTRRIEGELQRVLSELLRREIRDPRVGSITITDVRVSPDLKHARVFYTRFDEARNAAEMQAGLDGAAKFLRGLVGRSLKLRVAPELVFQPDEQLAAGMRLNSLIDSAVAHDLETHVDDPSESGQPEGRGAHED
jgi:ribosome-binding factor A